MHLRSRGYEGLAQRLKDGELAAVVVARLPVSELISGAQLGRQLQLRQGCPEAALASNSTGTGAATNEYTCPKCGGQDCSNIEKVTAHHTDGHDAIILVTCLGCRERWKAQDDHGWRNCCGVTGEARRSLIARRSHQGFRD